VGVVAVKTLFSAMTARTRFAELLLPVLLLPFMLPPLIWAVLATAALLAGRTIAPFDISTFRAAKLLLLAILMIAPMVVMLWITGTMDTRRVMPGMLILYVGLAALSLLPRPAAILCHQ